MPPWLLASSAMIARARYAVLKLLLRTGGRSPAGRRGGAQVKQAAALVRAAGAVAAPTRPAQLTRATPKTRKGDQRPRVSVTVTTSARARRPPRRKRAAPDVCAGRPWTCLRPHTHRSGGGRRGARRRGDDFLPVRRRICAAQQWAGRRATLRPAPARRRQHGTISSAATCSKNGPLL